MKSQRYLKYKTKIEAHCKLKLIDESDDIKSNCLVKVKCLFCKEVFSKLTSSAARGKGCNICGSKRPRKTFDFISKKLMG